MTQPAIWVIDTSSIAEVRRSITNDKKPTVFARMSMLVEQGRLVFAKQVVDELERTADPDSPDAQYKWAKQSEGTACKQAVSLEEVKSVLATVPGVLDPDKDVGVEEADPYLLALALRLRTEGADARIVTEEKNDMPRKMSLRTAAGLLGIPAVPLLAFLRFEKIY